MKLLMVGAALAAASAAACAADKPKAEVMTSWTSGSEAAALDVIKQEFEKRGGVWKDSSIAGFGAADAAFQNRLVAGDPPAAKQAVIGLANTDFVNQGLLSPIDDTAKAGKWADVLPKSILDLISYNGQVYLSPTDAHGESWVFYSKDTFAKAGVTEEPRTWDEFFAALDKLKAAGVQPVAWGGQSWQESKVFNMILLTQVGIDGFLKIYADKDNGDASVEGVKIVHAATAGPDAPGGSLVATGGRVLNVVATGTDFADARARAYDAIGRIRLDGAHYRSDIAARVAE